MSTSESKTVTLKSSDGENFEIGEAVAMQMQTIKNMIEDDCASESIPIPNLPGNVLSKVIEYCNKHVPVDENSENALTSAELKAFDTEFMNIDMNLVLELARAANYLDIKGLLDLGCQSIADRIKHYSVEKAREVFGIENDYTPEEERKVRNENLWAYED